MDKAFAPYAPPSAVLKIIRHYSDRDVPERVTPTNLLQLGVTEALAPRTMAALKFLGLLEEDGLTTERFRALRYASADDYNQVFRDMLEAAYKNIFDHVDVTSATETEISNAFKPYSPGGQRGRMITLFLALCQEAGLHVAVPPRVGTPRAESKPRRAASGKERSQRKSLTALTEDPRRQLDPNLLFGRMAEDLSTLASDEFTEAWNALGIVVRARAKSIQAAREMAEQAAARRAKEAEESR